MTTTTVTPSVSPALKWQGVILVGLGAVGFSTGIIFMRNISGLGPTAITFYRYLVAFLFFCALLPACGSRSTCGATVPRSPP